MLEDHSAIKNNTFVEANAMNISAKFQLYPHTDSEELICVYFPQIEPFSCHDNQSN